MSDKILPLGSVVTLKNGDGTEVMVISRASITLQEDGEPVYFDYGAVVVPNGMQTADNVFFFNRENVQKVVFEGYRNDEEEHFECEYDKWIASAEVPKGRVED